MIGQRAAIYVRCSTVQQNLDIQLNDLNRYIEARGLQLIETFQDHGVSGTKDSRPALDRMMKMARQRKFNFVIVWRLDRLGRNTRHLLSILDELQNLQISLVSHQEGFDLSTPLGRVVATVLAALSSFEREILRERVIAGVHNARAKGKKLGRPQAGSKDAVLELRAKGMTLRAISRELGISHGTVVNYLKGCSNL